LPLSLFQLDRDEGKSVSGDRDSQLDLLITESRRFTATSHLFWAIWSFLQAEESPVAFGYTEYGMDRLALYFHHKADMMELEGKTTNH
jgi:choline/ethanolamine kinase